MNQFYQNLKIKPKFARETRFPVLPAPAAPFRGVLETDLEQLKGRLLAQALDETANSELYALLRRAANEAAALAWATPYPLLLFPALFSEKAHTATRQVQQQAKIRERSRALLELAV